MMLLNLVQKEANGGRNVIKRKVCLGRKNLRLFASEKNAVGNQTN